MAATGASAIKFSGIIDDLKSHIYDVGYGQQADAFVKTLEEIAGYAVFCLADDSWDQKNCLCSSLTFVKDFSYWLSPALLRLSSLMPLQRTS